MGRGQYLMDREEYDAHAKAEADREMLVRAEGLLRRLIASAGPDGLANEYGYCPFCDEFCVGGRFHGNGCLWDDVKTFLSDLEP